MADPNAFPDKEKEDRDAKIDRSVKNILKSVDKYWTDDTVVKGEEETLKSLDKYWTEKKIPSQGTETTSTLFLQTIKIKSYVI